jgi:hypothetical protein
MQIAGLRTGSQSPHPRSLFSPAEDELLARLVAHMGRDNWRQVASHLPGRNARQCRDRWENFLSPGVTNAPWADDEEALLRGKVAELGNRWKLIATFFRARSDVNVKNHWQRMQRRLRKHQQKDDRQDNSFDDASDWTSWFDLDSTFL